MDAKEDEDKKVEDTGLVDASTTEEQAEELAEENAVEVASPVQSPNSQGFIHALCPVTDILGKKEGLQALEVEVAEKKRSLFKSWSRTEQRRWV
eukprot:752245-Hanusia_phi.AAC.1